MTIIMPAFSNLNMQYEDYFARGQYSLSLEIAQKLMALALQHKDAREQTNAYLKLMHCYYSLGEFDHAFDVIKKFRILCDEKPSSKHEIYLHIIRGYIYEYEDNSQEAVEAFNLALQQSERIQNPRLIAFCSNLYAYMLLKNGDYIEANQAAIKADQFIEMNYSANLLYNCQTKHILATTYIHLNEFEKAKSILSELEHNIIFSYNKKERSRYFFAKGLLAAKKNNFDEAITYFNKSEAIAFQTNDSVLLKRIYQIYSTLYAESKNYYKAFIHLQNYVHLQEQMIKNAFISKTREFDLTENVRLIENNAKIDGLSSLYNRSTLERMTNDWLHKANDANDLLCCAVFDVDNFKKINDSYGHLFGDEVIKKIGTICNERFKNADDAICARFGGDEFVIIMKDRSREEILKIADQLFNDISKNPIFFQDVTINIQISMGIVCNEQFPSHHFSHFFHAADQALYMAKRNGKNQIVFLTSN